MFVGVDTGGTFTDFICFGPDGVRFHKTLSTPDDPSRAIFQGIQELDLDPGALHLVHGSTVATNAILERKGVRTLFVTHKGLEDILTIGRQTRDELYSLTPEAKIPWVERDSCFGISGRMDAKGAEVEALCCDELTQLTKTVHGYDAVAVCLLFSFLNEKHEKVVGESFGKDVFVSLSHEVLAEYREYERASTTFLNAYVGPLVQRYLLRLKKELAPKHLFVMHSAGGVMEAETAGRQAVRLVLSGPAGGLVAASFVARQLNETHFITFDMGGTSTDVALLNGEVEKTTEGRVAGMPVSVPMLAIHTIGAGGGSIAWMDEAGLPQVGPESAGAMPGPACYGQGGNRPTVTDANVALGRIPATARLAGNLPLDVEAARQAIAPVAQALGLSVEEAALGIIRIAEEHMAGALRVVSVQRGHDPETFSLLCFGGAGGLHACALAEHLGMQKVVLPVGSGAFSALGMLAGRRQGEFSRSHPFLLHGDEESYEMMQLFEGLKQDAAEQMPELDLNYLYQVDMRYQGQGFHLTLPFRQDIKALIDAFEVAHEKAYGHRLKRPVEMMTLRLTAYAETPELAWQQLGAAESGAEPCATSLVYNMGEVPHYARGELLCGHRISGPALVLEDTATLWLPEGWQLVVSEHGHLLLERAS